MFLLCGVLFSASRSADSYDFNISRGYVELQPPLTSARTCSRPLSLPARLPKLQVGVHSVPTTRVLQQRFLFGACLHVVLVPESPRLRSSAPLALGLCHQFGLVHQLPLLTSNHSHTEHEGEAHRSKLKNAFEPMSVRPFLCLCVFATSSEAVGKAFF